MFLSGVLFILFLAGCWLYCLTDAARTPAAEFSGLPKRSWIAVIAVTFILVNPSVPLGSSDVVHAS